MSTLARQLSVTCTPDCVAWNSPTASTMSLMTMKWRVTVHPNQIIAPGFFPKASARNTQVCALNAGSMFDEELNQWMMHRDPIKHPDPMICKQWEKTGMNEHARSAQGHGNIKGMDVVTFIARHIPPEGWNVTCARHVVDCRPEKDEPWQLRITCGSNKLDCCGNTTAHSASMETIDALCALVLPQQCVNGNN